MKKFLSSILALLMLLSAFSCLTITGFAADTLTEKESNDTAATANEIKVAETNVGALQSAEDVDWYKFTSDKDYFTVDFRLADITDKDYVNDGWQVVIYDKNMDEVITYNPTTTFSSPKFPLSGTVYIKVKVILVVGYK